MKTLILVVLSAMLPCIAQNRSKKFPVSRAEALAVCVVGSEPLTPYGFAKATLVSLWYARNGAEHGKEMKQEAKETDNMFSFLTAMMRITKTSTNDFYCAKQSLRPFAAKENQENVRTGAEFFMTVYDAHININERLIQLLKKLDSTDQAELMDQISTLQVERSQRWADLVQPTSLALMMMVDLKRTDVPGTTTRLLITKAQKQMLVDWLHERFPEFGDGTPKDQWSDPSKTAQLYFGLLDSRKCADE